VAKILCVDDDSTASLSKRVVLQKAGHQVDICKSAEDAVSRLRADAYDALITDWRLTDGSARGIIQAARLKPETVVIVVSGFVGEAFQASGPPADLYLDKPVGPAELVMIIEALLAERKVRPFKM
jgi:DNA-binding response OmpR family regulator